MTMRPHGYREIWTEGRIFFSRNSGPFNLELFQKAGEESRAERIRLTKSGPWGSIAIVNDNVMFTPDALDLLRRNLADQERNANLVAAAFVVPPETEGRLFCEGIFSPIYAGAGAEFRLFETLEPAKTWVTGMIESAAGR
ncbi:hypothetical protein [Nisaea sp.]|uniref:hypothetical protein n=1 Tax=Nisaea sp. TaxID=2024842 RepID=UPI0032648653